MPQSVHSVRQQAAKQEIPMNRPQSVHHVVINAAELVRGEEQKVLEQLRPVVCEQSVTLDLRQVTRIDAAGLAALITLYCDACKAGHQFRISRPSHHVAELLGLVRLDRLLVAEPEDERVSPRFAVQETAA
jgi:anti-anti-sigma factor